MNWRKGIFRVCAVLSVAWACVVIWNAPELPEATRAILHHAPSRAELIAARKHSEEALAAKLKSNPGKKMSDEEIAQFAGPDMNQMTRETAWGIVLRDLAAILAFPPLLALTWLVAEWVRRGFQPN